MGTFPKTVNVAMRVCVFQWVVCVCSSVYARLFVFVCVLVCFLFVCYYHFFTPTSFQFAKSAVHFMGFNA